METIRHLGRRMYKIGSVQFLWGNPHVAAIFDELGVPPPRGYFLLRAAPLGRPVPDLVGSAFAFFPPVMVSKIVSRLWEQAPPERVLEVAVPRLAEAARSVFDGVDGLEELTELVDEAAASAWTEGRALTTAWRGVEWPADPAPRLFGAATVLREHRGDGHIHALVEHGLSPLQAVLLTAARRERPLEEEARNRGWRDEELAVARSGLEAAGAITADAITDAGRELWERVEETTDRMAAQPWRVLGDRVEQVVRLADTLVEKARW